MNVCSAYLSACITTINDDNSKGINAQLTSYTDFGIHEIRVGQIHRRPTRPKICVGLVLHVLHGSGAYVPDPNPIPNPNLHPVFTDKGHFYT